MRFASRGVSKLEYGCYLGACLAYLAQRQRDRVGIITFDNDIVTHVPPSAKHFNVVLHTLDRAKAERPGQPDARRSTRWPSTSSAAASCVLISDFYEEPDAILEAIKPLRFLGNDLIVFHVLDPAGDRLRLRRCVELRGPRERRADSGRARVVPRRSTAR